MSDELVETRAYDALDCLVIGIDQQARIAFINRFAVELLGYDDPRQLVGQPLNALLPKGETQSAELLAIINRPQASEGIEAELLHRDGSRQPVCWNCGGHQMRPLASTLLVGFDASLIRQCRASAAMFQKVVDNYRGSIVITDPQCVILYANPALLQMSGYPAAEVIGKTPALFKSGQTSDEVYRRLWETLAAGGIWNGEFINRRQNGESFLEHKTIAAIANAQGEVDYYLAIGEDISQRQHYQQQIENLLAVDQLTGLPNRTAFLRSLAVVLDSAQQKKTQATVLHVDLDDFFAVNEAFGACEADLVIADGAQHLKTALRDEDLLARLGNDKFAILLGPHEAGIEHVIDEVAGRILATIRSMVSPTGRRVHLTASIGIASYPHDGGEASELLSHAINATEQAKTAGGNSCCRFDTSTASIASGRRNLLNDLPQAIEGDQLMLHFQPQVSLFSGAIIGLEALVRWQHPQRGLLLPSEFVALAEQSAHIIDIGDWVLRETCRQMRAWLDEGLAPIKVAINLAARHFLVPGLPATIAEALASAGLEPRFLEIEITEGAMMQDVLGAIRCTTQLKALGVRLSLDDFGTGYSSLAYLSRFPIDVVKIDQSFIRDITTNPVNAAIAQATIAMSHKLGKIVLAEGVETEEQMQYLRRNECDEMQGHFFSPALPAARIARLLESSAQMALSGALGPETRSTVLLVDDDNDVLSALKRTLKREGYDILMANGAAEGFSLLARNDVQVIVSDQRMPEMNGTEFLSRVKSLYPKTVRMVLSGHSEISVVTDAINKGAVYRFMLKPWNDEKLKKEISSALRHWRELYGGRKDES